MSNDMTDQLFTILGSDKTPMSTEDQQALEHVLTSSQGFMEDLDAKKREKVKAKEAEEKQEELKEKLKDNQFLLSSFTQGKLPKSGLDRIIEPYADDYFPEDIRCDIPAFDENYYWDADLLEGLYLSYVLDEKCLLTGPPGTGKTSAIHQFAAIMKQPFARFNGKDAIEGSSFLGYPWATSSGMEWKDGLMTQAVQLGYLTVIDEIMKMPPGIQMALQSLYEKGGFLMLDDKPGTIKDKHVYPAATFRLFGTDNTKGTGDSLDKYGAGQMQDTSTLDRFTMTLLVNYLPKQEERIMLGAKVPGADEVAIKRIVSLATLVREAFDQGNLAITLSPRGCLSMLRLVDQGLPIEQAIDMVYTNKLEDDQEVAVAKKFVKDAI